MIVDSLQVGFTASNLWQEVTVAFFVYLSTGIIYDMYFHPMSRIAGPVSWFCSRLPFVWALLRGTIVRDIETLHRNYGPVLRIAPNEVIFTSNEAWGNIHLPRPNHQPFLKDPIWWSSQPGHPNSIINAIDPKVHSRIRKIYVNLLVEGLKDQAPSDLSFEIDISPWFNYTTFDIFSDLRFGESFECLEKSIYNPWIDLLFNRVKTTGFIFSARFYPWVEFILMKCVPRSLNWVQKDHYLQIVDKGLPHGEICATFMILTTARSETTATTLCGALAILTTEIRFAFHSTENITLAALHDPPYLIAVIQEALRLCPAIPWVLPRRVPNGADSVCGIWLPGKRNSDITIQTPVSIQAWKLTLIELFSTCPRNCMGQHLAWAEMRLTLAKLLFSLDLGVVAGKQFRWEQLRIFPLVETRSICVLLKARAVSIEEWVLCSSGKLYYDNDKSIVTANGFTRPFVLVTATWNSVFV
ncbi:cytochrome P450 [Paraphaeosphaeria sporulosa]|uniref:Cytochrome P450 n=1 Tax=Paraphaeosphaeria sporulosa TaxID=1460663 RepID=A0A177BXK9_9PLEO|nr:cytochrome P450 [Paraphaeosphaeria sporulosa]OAG00254.1 cytochrome P450 [Paraphaeosphaeria sporulosa]